MRRFGFVTLLLAAIFTLAACSGPGAPSFALSVTPETLTVAQGSSGQVTVTMTRTGGFDDEVVLELVNPPPGVSAAAVTLPGGSGTGVLTVSVSDSAAVTSSNITVRGTSGTLTAQTSFTLIVSPPQSGTGSAVLPETTKVLDEAALAALSSVSPEGRFTFAASTPVLQSLVVGDVFIAGVSEHTPRGALRKVESITPQEHGLMLETDPALMQEAFEDLELQLETNVGPSELSLQQDGLSFPLDLSASDDNGRVDLEGSLSLAPIFGLTLDIDIASFSLDELSLNFAAEETFLATLTGEGEVSFDESVTLGTVNFAPIILNIPYPGGVLPVVLTPQVVIEAGLEGRAEGSFEASVSQEASFTAGLGYRDGEFGGFSDSDSDFNFEQPAYEGALGVKALAGPRLEVLLYGAVGPFASAEAYVELSASAEGPPACARGVLNAGITAKAGVDFLADYETTLLNENFPLASFDSCSDDPNAPRPAITWARSFSRVGSGGEGGRAVIEASDGTYVVVGDSTLFGDVTAFAASLWVMRLDAVGNIMWQKAFARTGGHGLAKAVQEVPGGFVIATSSRLLKLDTGGNLQWARAYEGGGLNITSLAAHGDGNLIAAGSYGDPSQGWAMRLDVDGEVLWSRRFGGTGFNRVRFTSEGGYILVGQSSSNGNDVYLVKLDAGGNVSWRRELDNRYDPSGGEAENPTILDGLDAGRDVVEKPGGGYVLAGETYGAFPLPEPGQGGYYATWVAEVGGDGDLQDSTVYRAPADANYTSAYALAVQPNGSIVVVGRRADQATDLLENEDILVIQGGTFRVLGGEGSDFVHGGSAGGSMALQRTQDGGLILAATSDSFAAQEQFWLVKMGRTANIDFPYLASLPGAFYTNEHSASSQTTTSVTDAPVTVTTTTAEMRIESTEVMSLWQAP